MTVIKKQVIVDAGYLVALFHDQDSHNQQATDWEEKYGDEYELVTTYAVIQEIYQLLLTRVGSNEALGFMKCVSEGMIRVIPFPESWAKEIVAVLNRFSDKKLDFADVSIVLLADYLCHGNVLTVDRKDFEFLRWGNGKKYFKNLLYPT